MTKALNLPGATGALVAEVQKDSPASSAGIQPGDVMAKIGSQSLKDPRALAQIIAALHSGSDQEMTVRRDGQDKTLTVAVAAQPDQDTTVQSAAAEQGSKLGLALAPLIDEARQQMNLPPNQEGVGIADVKQDSPAQMARLHGRTRGGSETCLLVSYCGWNAGRPKLALVAHHSTRPLQLAGPSCRRHALPKS